MLGILLQPLVIASVGAQGSLSPAPPASYGNPIWVERLSYATLWDSFAIWNPTFGSDFDRGPLVISHLQVWWSALFVAAIVTSVTLSRRALAVVFFFLYLLGVFLYKGSQPPAGGFYIWAFSICRGSICIVSR